MRLLFGKPPVTTENAPLKEIELSEVVSVIRSYEKLAVDTKKIRKEKDKTKKRALKCSSLPYVLPFHYKELTRDQQNFIGTSLMIFEADHVSNLEELMAKAGKLPATVMAYRSVSGDGFKILVQLDTEVGPDNYVRAYKILARQIGRELGCEMDIDNTKDMARVQFLAHDPKAIVRSKVTPLKVSDIMKSLAETDSAPKETAGDEDSGEMDPQEVREAIEHARTCDKSAWEQVDYERWVKIGFAFASLGDEGRDLFKEFSKANPLYDEDDAALDEKFSGYLRDYGKQKKSVTMGSFWYTLRTVFNYERSRFDVENYMTAQFIRASRGRLIFDHSFKSVYDGWLGWDGMRFVPYEKDEVLRHYAELVEEVKQQNGLAKKYWTRAASLSMTEVVLKKAAADRDIAVSAKELDTASEFINAEDGMVDLRTGEVQPHDPRQRMTKLAPCDYTAGKRSKCPRFLKHVKRMFGDDLAYVQMALGYSLTSCVDEQSVYFLIGAPSTGKSTLLNVLRSVLGSYVADANYESFTKQFNKKGSDHSEDIMRLRGARMVISKEVSGTDQLSATKIKDMTGLEPLTSRGLHQASVEWVPQFKLWVPGNVLPQLDSFDGGFRRRPRVIEARSELFPGERKPDSVVKGWFDAEHDAIFAWLVQGELAWRKLHDASEFLNMSPGVERSTREFLARHDHVEDWMLRRCERGQSVTCGGKEAFDDFKNLDGHGKEMNLREFYTRLRRAGIEPKPGRGGAIKLYGLKLLPAVSAQATKNASDLPE